MQLLVDYAPKFLLNTEAKQIYYSWMFSDDYANSGNTASQSVRSYPAVMTCLADGHPKPVISWYYNGDIITADNKKYRLLKDEPSMAKLEVNPRTVADFGEYLCRAENRIGRQEQSIHLRQATVPKFPPLIKVKQQNPESVLLDIHPSDASDADGGMQIEAYKVQWRLSTADWSKPNEKEIPIDIASLDSATRYISAEYIFLIGINDV